MAPSVVTREAVTVIAVIGLLATFLAARGRFVRTRGLSMIPLLAWWLSPVAYYDWRASTFPGAVATGAALLAAGGGLLVQVYRSRGSTAAVGLVVAPLLIWVPLVLAVELDRALAT
jgi:hypothetical protein